MNMHIPFQPTRDQRLLMDALEDFLEASDEHILIVNGYAGTGKTTVLAGLVQSLAQEQHPLVLLAPTGRAAKVLSLYAGFPASTIHKHIYRQSSLGKDGFGRFTLAPNKARGAVFIVDEVSLIGIAGTDSFGSGDLLQDLVEFVGSGTACKLILVGDDAQLPPVGLDFSPALSLEYMEGMISGGVSFVHMREVVRQAQDSGILSNATYLRQLLPLDDLLEGLSLGTFPDVERITGGELLETLSDAYARYGEEEVMVLCRSNKRAYRYNAGIRAQVLFHEERIVRDEKLMVVKNHYLSGKDDAEYIANGDIGRLVWIRHFEQRYGLQFADACIAFPDYQDLELQCKVLLDTLEAEAPSLGREASEALYQGLYEDYAQSLTTRKKINDAIREDPYYNALQVKYAHAITCHKAQGGQWKCIFIDNPIWQDTLLEEDIRWLYTAVTRAVEKVYLVNFQARLFQ